MSFPNNSFTFSAWMYSRGYRNQGSIYNCIAGAGDFANTGWGAGIYSSEKAFVGLAAGQGPWMNNIQI